MLKKYTTHTYLSHNIFIIMNYRQTNVFVLRSAYFENFLQTVY